MTTKLTSQDLAEIKDAAKLESLYSQVKSSVPWTSAIYMPTDKILGMQRVGEIHNERLDVIYRPKLRALREKYKGTKRAFIIGNGPSLNRTDLDMLEGEVTFCMNSFFLKQGELNWTPTFYVVEDHLVAEDRADSLNALKGSTKLFPAYLGYCLDEGPETIFFNHRARVSYPHGFDFSTDAAKITYTGCTVTFTCMQLAFYLGFEEIYLIGVDASYDIPEDSKLSQAYGVGVLDMDSDDPNHFHPDYFGKGFRWHDPQVSMMLEAYEEARIVTDDAGQHIYNAGVGGKLEVFERCPFSEIFPAAIPPEMMDRLARAAATQDTNPRALTLAKNQINRWKNETHKSALPFVLLIDMVPIHSMAASGAYKKNIIGDWPRSRFMQVSMDGHHSFMFDGGPILPIDDPVQIPNLDAAIDVCRRYNPDLIIYRPMVQKPDLHELAKALLKDGQTPSMIWVLDDWLSRAEAGKSKIEHTMVAETEAMIAAAAGTFVISDHLGKALTDRISSQYHVLNNGVDLRLWRNLLASAKTRSNDEFVVRYSGGLADDMSLQSVLEVAEAIEALQGSHNVRFEINTRDHWIKQSGRYFEAFKGTSLEALHLPMSDYFHWLMDSDALLVAYNFDKKTALYAQNSHGNKIPEVLATGRPVLAVGPNNFASMKTLKESGGAILFSGPKSRDVRIAALKKTIEALIKNPAKAQTIGQVGQTFAFTTLRLDKKQDLFRKIVKSAASNRVNGAIREGHEALRWDLITPPPPLKILESQPSKLVQATPDKPLPPVQQIGGRGRIRKMISFYLSWRGFVAGTALLLMTLPVMLSWSETSFGGMAAGLAPPLALFITFIFAAYLYTLILDHHAIMENRVSRLERRRQK